MIFVNNERKNSAAKIRANAKYSKAHYKNISIKVKPEEAEEIRKTAENMSLSIAKLILLSVREYAQSHGRDGDGESASAEDKRRG